jgi:hypothetical protein
MASKSSTSSSSSSSASSASSASQSIANRGLDHIADAKHELDYADFEYKKDGCWIQLCIMRDSKNNDLYTITKSKSITGDYDGKGVESKRKYTLTQLVERIQKHNNRIQYFQMECVGKTKQKLGVIQLGDHN